MHFNKLLTDLDYVKWPRRWNSIHLSTNHSIHPCTNPINPSNYKNKIKNQNSLNFVAICYQR